MEILVEAHERFDEVLEDNLGAKHVATQKFEIWEKEHIDVLRRLKHRISELKQETLTILDITRSKVQQSVHDVNPRSKGG